MAVQDPAPSEEFAPDRFRAAEWHGRVIAGFGGAEDEAELDGGERKRVTRLELLVVFDRQGNIEAHYEDQLIWATTLRGQLASAPEVAGKLESRSTPYRLEPISDEKKKRVDEAVAASGLRRKVSRAARDRVADRRRGPLPGDGEDAF